MSIGTKAFAAVGLNSFYVLIFGERILFPEHLVRKRERVIAQPTYRNSTANMWKILRKI